MNFNILYGLGLILIDVIIRMAVYKLGMETRINFGFLYTGLLNVIAGLLIYRTPSLIFRIIVGSTMALGILYPISRFLQHLNYGAKIIDLTGYLGLWFMATGIIFLIFTPVRDE